MKRILIGIAFAVLCVAVMAAVFFSVGAASGIAGDINKDGEVNNKDVVVLFRYLSGGEAAGIDKIACDTNGDGEIDNKDVVTLFKHVSFPGYKIYYGKSESEEISDSDITTVTEVITETSDSDITTDTEVITETSEHVHTAECYSDIWQYNGDCHWRELICSEGDLLFNTTMDTHKWNENRKCTICGYVEMHSLMFVDYDGSAIMSDSVEWGTKYESIKKPNDPEHEGLTFTGWGYAPERITKDTVVTAQYKEILPKITFIYTGSDNELKTVEQTVEYGSIPTPPDASEVVEYIFNWQSYKAFAFSGWDSDLEPATVNKTYTAQYKNVYERPIIAVTFANIDNLNHRFDVFISLCNLKRDDRRLYVYNFTLDTSAEGKTYDVDGSEENRSVEFTTAGGWITGEEHKNYTWDWNKKSQKLSIGWSTPNLSADQNGTALTNDYENILKIHFSAQGPINVQDIRILPESCRLVISDDGGETMQSVQPVIIYSYN